MNIALKEWAVVVEAMAQGRQIFLLRKGGIAEGKLGFELKHNEFVFYPTWEHQQKDLVRPEFHELFDRVEPEDPEQLRIRHLGRVSDIVEGPASLEDALRLERHHVWNERYLRKRYEYRPDLPLYMVLVRPYRLPEAVAIPVDRRYAGCRSWVELYQDIPVTGAVPVLEEPEFQRAREDFLADLASAKGSQAKETPRF